MLRAFAAADSIDWHHLAIQAPSQYEARADWLVHCRAWPHRIGFWQRTEPGLRRGRARRRGWPRKGGCQGGGEGREGGVPRRGGLAISAGRPLTGRRPMASTRIRSGTRTSRRNPACFSSRQLSTSLPLASAHMLLARRATSTRRCIMPALQLLQLLRCLNKCSQRRPLLPSGSTRRFRFATVLPRPSAPAPWFPSPTRAPAVSSR